MSRALLSLMWRRHRAALVALAGGLFVFEWVITRLTPGPEQAELMRRMFELLPSGFRAILGEEWVATISARGLLGFGYAHPFAILMGATWAVRSSAGALAGEIGNGTMDLLAARPVRRGTLVAAGLITLLSGLALITASGWAGMATGLISRPQAEAPAAAFLPVAFGFGMLFAAFGCVGLAISAMRRTGGSAIAWTSAFIAGSFALNYLAQAWAPIRWMRPLSMFAYFRPRIILEAGLRATDYLTLGGVCVAGAAVALIAFSRRDL